MRAGLSALVVSGLLAGVVAGVSAETLPPPPAAYFNDYAGVVSAADAQRLDAKLRQLADETSTQVVVAVFRNLPSPSLEDFTVRTAQSWRVGRKDWDNGAILFVFVDDRKMRIETGYGLEGALPDQLAGRILDEQVRPRFRAGDWTGGLEAGIDGIVAATRGEYKAPPKPKPGRPHRPPPPHRVLRDPPRLARLAGLAKRPGGADLRLPRVARGRGRLGRRKLVGRGRLVGRRRWWWRRWRLLGGRRLLRGGRRLEQLVRGGA